MAEAVSPSSHSSFCEEVFSLVARRCVAVFERPDTAGRLQPNEVDRTNILAPGVCSDICRNHLLPAFTPERFRGLAQWEVVSSYSSATAPDLHGISCADPLFQARKELDPEVATCACCCKNYLINPLTNRFCVIDWLFFNLIVTGGAGFIGSNLTLALQEKFPDAGLTVIDDFRSGDFKNLAGYSGDFVAHDLASSIGASNSAMKSSTPFFTSHQSQTQRTTTSSNKCTTTWKVSGGS